MNIEARRSREFGVVALLSLVAGVASVVLAQKLEPLVLLLLIAAVPAGLCILPSLFLVFSKFRRLLGQLRWWHALWFVAYLSGLTFRVRGVENIQETPLDPAAFFRITLVGIVGVVLLRAYTLRGRPAISNLFKGLIGLLASYALVCMLSTLWSVYPTWTLYKSMEYLTMVALIAAIVGSVRTVGEIKTLFDWTWLLIGMVLLSVWVGVFLWPNEAILRGMGLLGIQIRGIFPRVSANGVGDLGALLGIISLVRFLHARGNSLRLYLAIFVISMISLILSQSRSPLTGFLLAMPLILFLDKRISLLTLGVLNLSLVILFTPLGDLSWQFFLRGQSEVLFFSFSGRVYYWQDAIEVVKQNPILGFGAYAAGRFLVAVEFSTTLSSLHGTWPEVLVGTGVLGLVPLMLAVLGTWKVLVIATRNRISLDNRLRHQLRLEAVGVMTLLSVRSIFSVSFIWHPALTWLLVLGYAEFLRRSHVHSAPP